MKFKKTKLTALAMSVLMAASTITSVTWAADFTDGAPAEAAVEAPIEVVSDAEAEEISAELDGNLLTAASYGDPEYEANGVIYDQANNEYYLKDVTVEVTGDPTVPNEHYDKVVVKPTGAVLSATCQVGERVVCEFEMHGKPYTAYYVRGEADTNHTHIKGDPKTVDGSLEVVDNGTSIPCDDSQIYYEYYQCPGCGAVKFNNGSFQKGVDITAEYKKVIGGQSSDVYFNKVTNYTASHKWDIKGKTVIPPDDVAGERRSQDIGLTRDDVGRIRPNTYKYNNVFDYLTATATSDYQTLANCQIINGQSAGKMLEDRDAYYYNYEQCSVCGETRTTGTGKEVFYYANMTEGQRYYEKVKGIKAFVTKNADGSLSLYGYNALTRTYSSTIPENLFYDVVLDNCSVPGTYNLCVATGTGATIIKEGIVKSGHTMKRIELDEDNSQVNDLAKDAGGYILDYDENHNVTGAYSKDCSTEAVYELKHVCFNSDYSDISVTGKKKAAAGSHVWVNRKLDPFKIDYKQVDALHHIEHYYDDVRCDVCDKTDIVDSTTPDALKAHQFAPAEIKDSRVEPTCGETGSYKRGDTCPCGLVDESTITTVTIPATDKHDFGTNEAFIDWTGEVYIAAGKGEDRAAIVPNRNFYAYVVRKCNVCGKNDSNGINTETAKVISELPVTVNVKDIVDAKKDPATGVTYPCSTAHATIYVDWTGTVDGKVVKLNSTTATNAVKENVPYYGSVQEYDGRTAHHKAPAVRENIVAPTDTTEGSYDEVIYCEVCGDEISRKTVKVSKLDPAIVLDTPAVLSAESAGYNSIKVTWSAVEGAASYCLYYRGGEATNWTRVKSGIKGTAYTYTSSNLVSGVKYRFTVRAVSGDVLSGYSAKGKVAAPKPAAPAVKSVAFSGSKATVTWNKVAGANGYIIQRKTTGGWTRVGTVKSGSRVTWTDKKAVSGATYRVRAYRTVENVNVYGPFSAAK